MNHLDIHNKVMAKRKVGNRLDPGVSKWFATHRWKALDKRCREKVQRILYGKRWWLPPNPGRGESYESIVARGLS